MTKNELEVLLLRLESCAEAEFVALDRPIAVQERAYDRTKTARAAILAVFREMQAERDLLWKALKAVEYPFSEGMHDVQYCFLCQLPKGSGHKKGCKVGDALAKAEGVKDAQ